MDVLAGHAGSFSGSSAFRMMPTDEPHTAPATAQVSLAAGGNLALLSYTWVHAADGEQSGLLVLGRGGDENSAVAMWSDTWHQAPAATWLQGEIEGTTVTVSYSYAEGWEWIISVDAGQADTLRLQMDNVVPDSPGPEGRAGGRYWAMQAELTRS